MDESAIGFLYFFFSKVLGRAEQALAHAFDDRARHFKPIPGPKFAVDGPNPELFNFSNLCSYLLKENQRDAEALKGLGICLFRLGDNTSARKCFQALLTQTHDEEALYWLGSIGIACGDDALAISHFQDLAHPEQLPPILRFTFFKELGNSLTRRGNLEAAEQSYRSALALEPMSDTIHVNLGTMEVQRGRSEEASAHFTRALEINPKNGRARCGLGILAFSREDFACAEREFLATLDIETHNLVALHHLLVIAHRHNDFSRVKEKLLEFVKNGARNADIHYALAVVLLKDSDWRGCERELKASLEINSSHVKARKLLDEVNGNHRRL